jgi:transposase
MSRHQDGAPVGAQYATILVIFELSKANWKIGILLPGARKLSRYTVDGGDLAATAALLTKARGQVPGAVRIASAYEAGFDGFWLHRWLQGQGVENRVLDPASIQVNRRARRAKTDKLDLDQLMRVLAALERGEPKVCSVLRPPSVEAEDERRLTRERERLVRERVGHSNRIKGLLFGQGVRDLDPRRRGFVDELATARTGDGRRLPPRLVVEVCREHRRLQLVSEQITELEAELRAAMVRVEAGSPAAKAAQLSQLKGVGVHSAWPLANEVFYRRFENRR